MTTNNNKSFACTLKHISQSDHTSILRSHSAYVYAF